MRLLIIEDNRRLVANLFDYFESRGHVLDAAPNGAVGKWLATTQRYDAVVLDRMLPQVDGVEMLRALRQEANGDVPVLMLTARAELADKVAGFQAGADDYLTKPFEFLELEMRLNALVTRAKHAGRKSVLRIADLSFNRATLEAHRGDRKLHLFPALRTLLCTLMEASPAVVTRETLEEAVWGDDPPASDRLRAYVYELRREVDGASANKLIHTVPRVGYRLGAE
jgi:DNA-binding response OmpR family regulator